MRYVGVAAIALTLSAAALTGCESGGAGGRAPLARSGGVTTAPGEGGLPASVTACSPLPAATVARVLTTAEVVPSEDSSGRVCRYVLPDGTPVLTVAAADLPRAVLGGPAQVAAASAAGAGTSQPVGGVGDAAYFYVTAQGAHALTTATGRGETVTSVTLIGGGPARQASRDRLVDLGRHVLREIGRAREREAGRS